MTFSSFLADNWYWAAAATASGGLLLWQQLREAAVSGGTSPAMAVQLINRERAQVIDVRDATEFAAGHVTGAKNLPLGQLGSVKGLPSNKKLPLVVVCATGQRSAKAVAQLKALGHENVQPLSGGLKAWREANLPVEKTSA
jgi:rhodanese-related sulfurtransferase